MKKGRYAHCFLFVGLLCLCFLAVAARPALSAEVIRMSYANFFPPTHEMSKLSEAFCREAEKRSNGRLAITFHPAGSVLTAPRMYDGVVKKIVDIGYSHAEYTRGKFAVSETLSLPLGYPSGWVATKVANDFYNEFKPKEWDETHPLYFHNGGTGAIQSTKPVRKLEDFKGIKLRAPGATADVVKALGGTPRDTPMAETYDGISKGVLDGSMTSLETLKGWKFAEVCKYATDCWEVGIVYPWYVVMNKSSWNALPADLKKMFTDLSTEWAEKRGRAWDDINAEGVDHAVKMGLEVIRLSPQEGKRWEKAVEPLEEEYVKKMVTKGVPADQSKKQIAFAKERIAYWTKKQIELGIKSPTGPAEMRK